MPQPKSISPGKGREALRQKKKKGPNLSFKIWYGLTVHIIPQNSHYSINLLYIMFQAPAPAENPAEFQRITQIPRNSPTQSTNYAKFAVLLTYSILCFRHLPQQRTLRNSSKLRKFRAIHPHSPRIT